MLTARFFYRWGLVLCTMICGQQLVHGQNNASQVSKAQTKTQDPLQQFEKLLQPLAAKIMNEEEWVDRLRADSSFTRNLVEALRTPYSFHYRFDSLRNISQVYAPDSSFRVITWQLFKDFTLSRYKGAIQMKTADGSLKLVPLFDVTDYTENPADSVRGPKNWIGALYYNIVQTSYNNKQYYTLFGYDENDARSTRKWMEVLHFDNNGQPLFGGKFFQYPADAFKPKPGASRFYLEFKKDAAVKLNWDPESKEIAMAKLVSESGENTKPYTFVPYGSIEGFKWELGKWIFIPARL